MKIDEAMEICDRIHGGAIDFLDSDQAPRFQDAVGLLIQTVRTYREIEKAATEIHVQVGEHSVELEHQSDGQWYNSEIKGDDRWCDSLIEAFNATKQETK